jgi:hypothetical protein
VKRSSTIIIGSVLAALTLACADGVDEPEQSDVTEVCVDESQIILPEIECENGSGHGSFIYVPGSNYVGAHGSKYTGSYGVTKPPSGTIGRVPSSGGFGTHAGTGG